ITISKAVDTWQNRFGIYTGFRFSSEQTSREELQDSILNELNPTSLGFTAEEVRVGAEFAADEGVDFGQLFGGLSFFLLASGILLIILMFLLNLEFRKSHILTLSAVGIPRKDILRTLFAEGIIIAIIGSALGLLLAILYTQAIFSALNGIWQDIVRTEMMLINISAGTLLTGLFLSMIVSSFALLFPLNRYLRKNIRHSRYIKKTISGKENNLSYKVIYQVTFAVAAGIIVLQLIRNEAQNASMFFIAGGLLLVSGIALFRYYLLKLSQRTFSSFKASHLSIKNAFRNPSRSMTIVILFALATFLVISTGSNRKDLFVNAEDPSSGTGGFLYYAESTVPVLNSLNRDDIRFQFGLNTESKFVQFRKAEGDDASCLNLNRIINPEIIATDPDRLSGRFSFVTRTPYLDEENPWLSLNKELTGGLIPAIADETVIKWGLGMKVGDTLRYIDAGGDEMNLLLIGGLAPSIFQGKVIISNKNFLQRFPQSSGTHVFLVEGATEDSTAIIEEMNMGMRDFGIDVELAAKRLVEFYSVTNTYLSIFIVMGAIGLLLGTIGLGIVLYRSILERKNEIAILRAVGFKKPFIRKIITREYLVLLVLGIGIGFITAIIATLPSLISPNTGVSITSILVILVILLVNGWFWTRFISSRALRNKSIYQSLRNE
ncbi:MAG: FtsX-like permease family protein, partial [Bacteroidales bacterium]